MNLTASPVTNAPLSLLTAEHDQTQPTLDAAFALAADFQDLCSLAMDQALGFEKASLDAVVLMQSCAIEAMETSNWVSPAYSNLLDLAVQAIASCLELQLGWLAMMTPSAADKTETSLHLAPPLHKAAPRVRTMPQTAVHELDHSMDIAMGERRAA